MRTRSHHLPPCAEAITDALEGIPGVGDLCGVGIEESDGEHGS